MPISSLRDILSAEERKWLYLEAAQTIESNHDMLGCCIAIYVTAPPQSHEVIKAEKSYYRICVEDFTNLFTPPLYDEWSTVWWYGEDHAHDDERVLALCFMAAMVDTGDA